jgi:hypothetical protein
MQSRNRALTPILALTSAAAAAAIAFAAAPNVHAQGVDASATVGDHGNWTLRQREEWLNNKLEQARDDGSVDHREFNRVRREMSAIRDDEDRMRDHHSGNQLTDNETAELETRLDGVADQIHWLHENSFRKPW